MVGGFPVTLSVLCVNQCGSAVGTNTRVKTQEESTKMLGQRIVVVGGEDSVEGFNYIF